jgi:RsiW-degrading membrane proteinase PrsW (M82 family)
VVPADHGRALAFELAPDARSPLVALRERDPDARVALVRGSTLVAAMPIDQAASAPLVVSFGKDLTAFARAHRTRLLLRSPLLAPMHRTSVTRLPSRPSLAAACALLPFVLSFAWLFFVRRFDRARPEPAWLVVATFALGGLSVIPAALVEVGFASATPWLDASEWTLGGQLWAFPLALVAFTLTTGAVEEGAKWLAVWSLASHRREFDEPVDGIVYGCASALGFAAVENVKYFALGRMSGVIIAVRAFMTVPAHMFFGALWGYAMGRSLVSRKARVGVFFALAALAHGTFDAALSIDGTQLVAAGLVVGLGLAFVVLLQRALRHGAVLARPSGGVDSPLPTEPMPASALARAYFRVGSPIAFYGAAAGMVACAFALTVLGTAFELLQHRIGPVFVTLATGSLALFGCAAYVASGTIPLDVVVDAQGLTFAGRQTPWTAVLGLSLESTRGSRAFVNVQSRECVIRLGPARLDTARRIAESIERAAGWRHR